MIDNAKFYENLFELVDYTLHSDYLEVLSLKGVSKETESDEEHGKIIPFGKECMVEEFVLSKFYDTSKPDDIPETIERYGETYKFICMAQRYKKEGYIGKTFPAYVNVEGLEPIWILYEPYVLGRYEGEPERMTYIFNSIQADLCYVEERIKECEISK
jgi:hypothetical protein